MQSPKSESKSEMDGVDSIVNRRKFEDFKKFDNIIRFLEIF